MTGMESIGLKDRVVLVTGGARGLGYAYAKCLLAEGAKVALHDGGVDPDGGSPDPTMVMEAAERLGAGVLPIPNLLGDRASCRAVVEHAIDHFGQIEAVIHNAGVVIWRETLDVTEEELRSATAINHETAFWIAQAALEHMRDAGFGRIVLTGSGWTMAALPGADRLSLYCLSKAAQFGLSMALGQDPTSADIKTNLLVPVAKTRVFVRDVAPGELEPAKVAGVAAWLASPACKVTGQVIRAADGKVSVHAMTELAGRDLGEAARDPAAAGAAIMGMVQAS